MTLTPEQLDEGDRLEKEAERLRGVASFKMRDDGNRAAIASDDRDKFLRNHATDLLSTARRVAGLKEALIESQKLLLDGLCDTYLVLYGNVHAAKGVIDKALAATGEVK